MLRIRSEHAIGFLKGRFQSLKNLRLQIRDEMMHKIACYWVAACVGIHAFAMECEAEEKAAVDNDDGELEFDADPFIAEGLSSDSGSSDGDAAAVATGRSAYTRTVGLHAAKAQRESLKQKLFHAKMRKAQQRHAAEYM